MFKSYKKWVKLKFYLSAIWKIILSLELPILFFLENKFEIACFRKKCLHFSLHCYWNQLKWIKFLVIKLNKLKNQLRKVTSKVFKGHYGNYRRFTDKSQTTTDVSKTITDDYRRLTENYRRITEESQTSHRRVKENYRPVTDES